MTNEKTPKLGARNPSLEESLELSPWINALRSEMELGDTAFARRDYSSAHRHFYSAYRMADKNGLARIAGECLVRAGDAACEDGGWLNYQKAGYCYALAGDREKLEGLLKELKYSEEDITGGSWMGMARTLADMNKERYYHGN